MIKDILKQLKNHISYALINSGSWKTNRKIIVIESDDWGSIRMPGRNVYKTFLDNGYRVDTNPYERYDSLASEEDLEYLFNTLSAFKDAKGNYPVITANVIMANPDFDKIEASGFTEYFYEPFTATLQKYGNHSNSFSLWKDGMQTGVFFPQYHGREHLNVSKFMKALHDNDPDVHFAFKHRMPGSIPKNGPAGNRYVEATRYTSETDKWQKLDIFLEGYKMFTDTFGFASKTVIPTNYVWSHDFDEKTAAAGIQFYQGIAAMREPDLNNFEGYGVKLHKHYLGEANASGQKYLIRNAVFEPSVNAYLDSVNTCLKQIDTAFRWGKPAIISSHRLNFIGYIDAGNRDRNLKLLETLIRQILKKWPDAEFMHSQSLAEQIN